MVPGLVILGTPFAAESMACTPISANAKFVREKIAMGNGPIYGRYMKLWDDSLVSSNCDPRVSSHGIAERE